MASSMGLPSARRGKDIARGDAASTRGGLDGERAVGIETEEPSLEAFTVEPDGDRIANADRAVEPGRADRREAAVAPALAPDQEMPRQYFEHHAAIDRRAALRMQ